MERLKLSWLVIVLSLFVSDSSWAANIRVPADQATIQAAIDIAADGDLILIADGTYSGAGNIDLDFGGKGIVVQSENGPLRCIIDATGGDRGFYFHNGETSAAEVRGITIMSADGAGIYLAENVSPRIRSCVLSGNGGDGIYAYSSAATIEDCLITGNDGNGITALSSTLAITNSEISDNGLAGIVITNGAPTVSASIISGNEGGGVVVNSSSPEIRDSLIYGNDDSGILIAYGGSPLISRCVIRDNTASVRRPGGGITIIQSSPTLESCVISGNSGGNGGGVYLRHASPEFTGCTITANESLLGGGVFCDYSSPLFKESRIDGNSGSGIYSQNFSTPELRNTIISRNAPASGVEGGGIHALTHSAVTIANSTIVDNDGYGIYGSYAGFVVNNAILWGNESGSLLPVSSSAEVNYSLVQGGFPGTGNLSLNPLFIDADNGDYRISTNSPAIDSGMLLVGTINTDIAGRLRPVGNGYDIGAYEGGSTPLASQVPAAPVLAVTHSSQTATASWTSVANADNYIIYYALYPAAPEIMEADMGSRLTISVDIPSPLQFYVAMRACNSAGCGDYSNIEMAGVP